MITVTIEKVIPRLCDGWDNAQHREGNEMDWNKKLRLLKRKYEIKRRKELERNNQKAYEALRKNLPLIIKDKDITEIIDLLRKYQKDLLNDTTSKIFMVRYLS